MKKDNGKHIAMCCLDCSSCNAFIATQNNNDELRRTTAEEWTKRYKADGRNRPPIKPEDINCRGCLSNGSLYLYCRQCKIRKCGITKEIKNCKECAEYKCPELVELQSHFF